MPHAEITAVQKMAEGRYLLNDAVIISNFDFTEEGVSYKVDYDGDLVDEKTAIELADLFVKKSIEEDGS